MARLLSIRQQDQSWGVFMQTPQTHRFDCGIVQFGARSSEQAAVCPEGRGTLVLIQKPNGDIAARIEVVK